jgi:hypothetical protein
LLPSKKPPNSQKLLLLHLFFRRGKKKKPTRAQIYVHQGDLSSIDTRTLENQKKENEMEATDTL